VSQLSELARRFPESLVKQKPGGKFAADFVGHATINERLLECVGPFSWEIVTTVTNPDGTLVGCTGRLTVTIDGREVTIVEAGDVEHPGPNNGSNLKVAASDAFKRAAMRIGLGLHLWSPSYFLDKALAKRDG
jgi:hypothetical protein